MLWTVKKAARYLGMEFHQVHYLISMGEIESIKIGNACRLTPEVVIDYDKRSSFKKNRKFAGNFIYTGDGGFLFRTLSDNLSPDPLKRATVVERRRRALVHRSRRPQTILFPQHKPVIQLELFSS